MPVNLYYLDTNPLLDWAAAQAGVVDIRCQRVAAEVDRIIMDTGNTNAMSEITLAEFQTNLSKWERDSAKPDFNSSVADHCLDTLMRWITDSRIKVLEQPPRLIEKTMAYVRFATREHMRDLRAWDAAHLYQACYWARSRDTIVHIVTSDEDFPKILEAFTEFTKYVKIYDPDTQTVYP